MLEQSADVPGDEEAGGDGGYAGSEAGVEREEARVVHAAEATEGREGERVPEVRRLGQVQPGLGLAPPQHGH